MTAVVHKAFKRCMLLTGASLYPANLLRAPPAVLIQIKQPSNYLCGPYDGVLVSAAKTVDEPDDYQR